MSYGQHCEQLNGFMILPLVAGCKYRGVDRNPFEPLLLDEEMDFSAEITPSSKISDFYPQGWRQEAYRLYEQENVVIGETGPSMLVSLDAAVRITRLLPQGLGPHEILYVSALPIQALPFRDNIRSIGQIIGYDVAYPGGDYYSAVRNAFLVQVNQPTQVNDWREGFRQLINEHFLFTAPEQIVEFLTSFKRNAPSEAQSEFMVYRLALPWGRKETGSLIDRNRDCDAL